MRMKKERAESAKGARLPIKSMNLNSFVGRAPLDEMHERDGTRGGTMYIKKIYY